VAWRNELPDEHLLPIDQTIHGAEPDTPEVRTVVHLHGGNTVEEYDGYPEAWFTSGFEETGPFFEEEVYEYANEQPLATLWYHDHALGATRLNVYAGLAGAYLIRGRNEEQSLRMANLRRVRRAVRFRTSAVGRTPSPRFPMR
jgi:spore coat protein A, manganese oxidase